MKQVSVKLQHHCVAAVLRCINQGGMKGKDCVRS